MLASTHQGGKVSLWCRSGPERICIQLTLSDGAEVAVESKIVVSCPGACLWRSEVRQILRERVEVVFVCPTGLLYIGAAQEVGDGAGQRHLRAQAVGFAVSLVLGWWCERTTR